MNSTELKPDHKYLHKHKDILVEIFYAHKVNFYSYCFYFVYPEGHSSAVYLSFPDVEKLIHPTPLWKILYES
jgi:hypothetical protein